MKRVNARFLMWRAVIATSGLWLLSCSGSSSAIGDGDFGTDTGTDPNSTLDGTESSTLTSTGDDTDPSTGSNTGGGAMCDYDNSGNPRPCQCDDGIDNDSDGFADADDLHCFGPFDDDEGSYATGIPGDNNGAKGNRECPFDGNSGVGNDDICCNPEDPSQNVTPNGCDDKGCCEVDVNGNGTGEFVWVGGECSFAPKCAAEGSHGCPCDNVEACDSGQFCIADKNTGARFCSLCEACGANLDCLNPCDCGETCFAGFTRPPEECGGQTGTDTDSQAGSCPSGHDSCPNGHSDCDIAANEICVSGCCYPSCPAGVVSCKATTDCPTDKNYYCVTGCCIEAPPVI